MASSILFGALVMFSSGGLPATAAMSPSYAHTPSFVLTIAMTSDCTAGDDVLDTARREATRVWSGAGVVVRWVAARNLPYASPRSHWLVARCTDSAAARPGARAPYVLPIAAIRFVGAQPTNTIVLSPSSANALLDREVGRDRDMANRFRALQNVRLGRMLGRAIAHEIGHFLSASGTHTRSGLMRASHTVTALTGDSLDPFRVDRHALAPQRVALRPPPPMR